MHTPKPLLALLLAASASMAQAESLKIGLILPLTGPFASTGKQIEAGARLYMAQQGDTVADRKVELIVKDDTGAPDMAKRIAQELVVNDKVSVLAGFGLTPLAMATAPIATQSKTPLVVIAGSLLFAFAAFAVLPLPLPGICRDRNGRVLRAGRYVKSFYPIFRQELACG